MARFQLLGACLAFVSSVVAADQCPPGYTIASWTLTTGTQSVTSLTTTTSTTSTSKTATPTPDIDSIKWQPCGTQKFPTLQCAYLGVPLDWHNPTGPQIDLPVIRRPADSPNPRNKSIITNPGGPGVSGILGMVAGGAQGDISTFGDDWHIVTFDPRGVGLTIPYQCQGVGPLEGDTGADFDVPDYDSPLLPDTDAWFNDYYEKNAATGLACAEPAYKAMGEVIGSVAVARDVNAIAQALGEDGLIRYYGASYGTLLGATIAYVFPDKIDRMILDGNINPTDYYFGLGTETVADYDRGLIYFFESCALAGPSECALAEDGMSGEQLLARYWDFYNNVRYEKMTTSLDGEPADYNDILDAMFQIIFEGRTDYDIYIPKLVAYYENRQNTSLSVSNTRRQTIDPQPFNPATAKHGIGATLIAITCGDGIRFSDVNGGTFRAYQDIWQAESTYGYEKYIALLQGCSTWQVDALEKPVAPFVDIKTRNPILFVQNPFDPVTPLISAQNSSAGFVGSGVLKHYGTGHCSGRDPNTEAESRMKSYFSTGQLPDLSTIAYPDKPPFPGLANPPFKRSPEQELKTAELEARAHDLFHRDLSGVAHPELFSDLATRNLDAIRRYAEERDNQQQQQDNWSAEGKDNVSASCVPITSTSTKPHPPATSTCTITTWACKEGAGGTCYSRPKPTETSGVTIVYVSVSSADDAHGGRDGGGDHGSNGAADWSDDQDSEQHGQPSQPDHLGSDLVSPNNGGGHNDGNNNIPGQPVATASGSETGSHLWPSSSPAPTPDHANNDQYGPWSSSGPDPSVGAAPNLSDSASSGSRHNGDDKGPSAAASANGRPSDVPVKPYTGGAVSRTGSVSNGLPFAVGGVTIICVLGSFLWL